MVGKSRAILDAMACGRAAYVLDFAGGDGWVTEERYAAWATTSPATRGAGASTELARDLAGYDPAMGQVNRDSCSPTMTPPTTPSALVALFRRYPPRGAGTGPLREIARLVRLQWATDQDAIVLRQALPRSALAQ